jgi:hypothetical protein
MGWKSQHTDEDKPLDTPDNLFRTLPGDPGAHGRFDAVARPTSLVAWLAMHRPQAAVALTAGVALALALRRRPERESRAGWLP